MKRGENSRGDMSLQGGIMPSPEVALRPGRGRDRRWAQKAEQRQPRALKW